MGPSVYEEMLGALGHDQQKLLTSHKRAGREFGMNSELCTAYALETISYSGRIERQRAAAGAQTGDAQGPLPHVWFGRVPALLPSFEHGMASHFYLSLLHQLKQQWAPRPGSHSSSPTLWNSGPSSSSGCIMSRNAISKRSRSTLRPGGTVSL